MNIANADGASFRADINAALQAIAELQSGSSAPSTTFSYMWWADTTDDVLKIRNAANTEWIEVMTLSSGEMYTKLRDAKSTTVVGGTFTQDVWQKRTVTIDDDIGDNVASISSSVFVLEAGTYRCFIRCPAYRVNEHQARLRNETDNSTILGGSNERASNADNVGNNSFIQGRFTIAASQDLEIQHRCVFTHASSGFGKPHSFGGSEIYTVAEFWKVA